jgi:hypothetical protein
MEEQIAPRRDDMVLARYPDKRATLTISNMHSVSVRRESASITPQFGGMVPPDIEFLVILGLRQGTRDLPGRRENTA